MTSSTFDTPWLYRSEAFFEDLDEVVPGPLRPAAQCARASAGGSAGGVDVAWNDLVRAVDAVLRSASLGRQGA